MRGPCTLRNAPCSSSCLVSEARFSFSMLSEDAKPCARDANPPCMFPQSLSDAVRQWQLWPGCGHGMGMAVGLRPGRTWMFFTLPSMRSHTVEIETILSVVSIKSLGRASREHCPRSAMLRTRSVAPCGFPLTGRSHQQAGEALPSFFPRPCVCASPPMYARCPRSSKAYPTCSTARRYN